jgi:hypothetical protein
MITLAHSTIVQRYLDEWMQSAQPRPTEDDLRNLIKILEDSLDDLVPTVEALQSRSKVSGRRDPEPAARNPLTDDSSPNA